jgi:adenylate kinase
MKENSLFNIALLGGPGSGKGTQAPLLAKHFDLIHFSTGALFRQEIALETTIGKQAKILIDNGNYCPDEMTLNMLNEHIMAEKEARGFIFDGVPRTLQQAKMMDGINYPHPVPVTLVVNLKVDEREIIKRIEKRYQEEGRSDDQLKILPQRIKNYYNLTEPLIGYYAHQNRLIQVDGMRCIEDVFQDVITHCARLGYLHKK